MSNRLDTELLITAGVDGLPHIDRLIDRIDAAGGDTDQLREAAQKLRDEWNNLSAEEQAKRLRDLGNAANQGAEDVGLLEQNTERTTSAFDKFKNAIMAIGAALGIAFIVGKIKSFFTDAVEGAAEFEQQLATVQAVSGATTEQMERIKLASEELGKSTRYNSTQAAEGFEILARAGLDVEASLKTIPSVLALAQGNALELGEAAGYITNAVQGMGLSFDDAARVADVMAKAAASANTDVSGMGAALSYAAPSAAALGISIEQTAAYIGQFANAGIDASRAGTSFNSMLSQFSNSTSSFRRELANVGITTTDFNEAIRQLAEKGSDGQAAINALGMEAGPALKALLAQGMGSLDGLKAKLDEAGGTAQAQADTMNATWQGALANLDSAWQYLKDRLGESFLEPMAATFDDLSNMIVGLVDSGKINQLGDSLARVFAEGAKAVIDFVSKLDFAALIDKVSTSLDAVKDIGRGVNGAFEALSITFNVFKSGILAIGVAVSMVITVFVEINKLTLDVGRSIAGFFGITSDAADGMSNAMGGALQASEDFRNYATKEMGSAADSIGNSMRSIAGSAEDSAADAGAALGLIPGVYGQAMSDVEAKTLESFDSIVDAAEKSGTDATSQAGIIRQQVIQMMQGFDQPEQFAALIKSIVATGNEAVVGGELLQQMGQAAGQGSDDARQAADVATAAIAQIPDKYADAISDVEIATRSSFDNIVAAAEASGAEAEQQAEQIRNEVIRMMDGFDQPEQFAALIESITATGKEAIVGADLLQKMGDGAALGSDKAQASAEKAKAAIGKLGEEAAKQAEQSQAAIGNTFDALGIDISQSLNGVNSKTQQTFDLIVQGAKDIGESTYSASEKTKLLAAMFAQGLNAAKTKEEFEVLNQLVKDNGLASVVTAEQAKALKLGVQGGAEAVKAAADAEAKQTAELQKNQEAAAKNAQQSRESAKAKDEQAAATDKAADATAKATQNESASLAYMQQATASIKAKITALDGMSVSTEQADAVWKKLTESIGAFNGKQYSGLQDFANDMNRVDSIVKSQVSSFEAAKSRAEEMTKALSGNAVTSRDLANAQGALRQATDASVGGLIRMDSQTLSGLQNAIDSAKGKMEGFAQSAKATADQLEITLAKIKGEDDKSLKLEQSKKLLDLEAKIAEARARNNRAEVAELERALNLQKQINAEESKQARAREQSSKSSTPSSNGQNRLDTTNAANDIVNAMDERYRVGQTDGANAMADSMLEALKRRAR